MTNVSYGNVIPFPKPAPRSPARIDEESGVQPARELSNARVHMIKAMLRESLGVVAPDDYTRVKDQVQGMMMRNLGYGLQDDGKFGPFKADDHAVHLLMLDSLRARFPNDREARPQLALIAGGVSHD
jgi:hypothetical protein